MRSRPSVTSPRVNLMQLMQHLHTACTPNGNYVLRVIDLESHSLSELLQPLETAIMSTFFSALTGQSPGETVRKLLLTYTSRWSELSQSHGHFY